MNELKELPKKGDVVGFEGLEYTVTDVGSTVNWEAFGGRTRSKSGVTSAVQLYPVDKHAEEISGWVPINRLKKIEKKKRY